jgi:hypothetical protein
MAGLDPAIHAMTLQLSPTDDFTHDQSSGQRARSVHSGLPCSIRSIFHFRGHFLSDF